MTANVTKKAIGTMSKKRYHEIEEALFNDFGNKDLVDRVLSIIRDKLAFDPDVSSYSEKGALYEKQRRERLKQLGVSTYVSSGAKTAYYKKKESVF